MQFKETTKETLSKADFWPIYPSAYEILLDSGEFVYAVQCGTPCNGLYWCLSLSMSGPFFGIEADGVPIITNQFKQRLGLYADSKDAYQFTTHEEAFNFLLNNLI